MINVGLIGYGRYGKKYYKNLSINKNFNLIKILRKSKTKKNSLFTNNKNEFFKINNIDLYIIASPTNTHYSYLKYALNKKKHIIIEKPLVSKFNEFNKIKQKISRYKKIILINHTDLYVEAFLNLKRKIKEIGKIKIVKLDYGKIDPYKFRNIKNRYELPHFEWLPHPLAIVIDLFKDQNFKIKIFEKRKNIKNKLIQNLKTTLFGKNIKIEIDFSNDYKNKKRNLEIVGSTGSLIYKGYNEKKCFIRVNKKTRYLKAQEIDPIKNLLINFQLKLKMKKLSDDKKLILSSTKYLFEISNSLNI
ncbi:Gfo/Idh/MocA family oxidoreductase [Pelagibacterales bacterium SAG-MED13]|nr:Gfo/Idh/MocA family oxidoreductase [Pelagibacterales bacterium SAG-MED13]|tara:strand:+ start:65 stop:973 length:909 start_codon:yes stop_codon:yes gene_type:complete